MHWKMENQWQVFRVRLVLPLVLHKEHMVGGQREVLSAEDVVSDSKVRDNSSFCRRQGET